MFRYDLKLIRGHLVAYLLSRGQNQLSVIKKNGAYVQIRSERLTFLDIAHYLSPNTSYDK